MQTVAASVVLDDAYRMIGWDADQLDDRELADARMALSRALQEVWEAWWWSELMECDQQDVRTTYDAAVTYGTGEEVYFPATQKYYQSLQPTTGNAPETLTGGTYELNAAYWAECSLAPSAPDYDSTATYAVGDQVRSLDDGLFYQKILDDALYIASAGTGTINGRVPFYSTISDRPAYVSDTALIEWSGLQWQIRSSDGAEIYYSSDEDVASPDLVTAWTVRENGTSPAPSVVTAESIGLAAGGLWSAVNAFEPSLDTEGTLRVISRLNPLRTTAPGEYEWEPSGDGTRIYDLLTGRPWVWRRLPTPILTALPTTDAEAALDDTCRLVP